MAFNPSIKSPNLAPQQPARFNVPFRGKAMPPKANVNPGKSDRAKMLMEMVAKIMNGGK